MCPILVIAFLAMKCTVTRIFVKLKSGIWTSEITKILFLPGSGVLNPFASKPAHGTPFTKINHYRLSSSNIYLLHEGASWYLTGVMSGFQLKVRMFLFVPGPLRWRYLEKRNFLTWSSKKKVSCFGLTPNAVTQIKLKKECSHLIQYRLLMAIWSLLWLTCFFTGI